jgi:hypothetical protein
VQASTQYVLLPDPSDLLSAFKINPFRQKIERKRKSLSSSKASLHGIFGSPWQSSNTLQKLVVKGQDAVVSAALPQPPHIPCQQLKQHFASHEAPACP